jgi:precorrin-6A/cobalt-precorrin-6A reductase
MRLLLLAGIADATQIAWAIAHEPRVIATASIARQGMMPISLGMPTRIGGWKDESDFRDWLRHEGVEAILDASHPFSTHMTARAHRVADELGLDYLRFIRPQWLPRPDDNWTFLNGCEEVEMHVPAGARALIDTNAYGSDRLGELSGRRVYFRFRDRRPEFEFPEHWRPIIAGRRPSVHDELKTFRMHGIDWLVTLNAGGVEEVPKLEAARRLGLSVAMVRRPPLPEASRVSSVSEIVNWMRRRI